MKKYKFIEILNKSQIGKVIKKEGSFGQIKKNIQYAKICVLYNDYKIFKWLILLIGI